MSKINVNNIEANDASTDITVTTGGSQSLLIDTDGKLTVAGNLSVNGNNYPSAGPLSNRNLIINGAMQVAQRGTSLSLNATQYLIDRFRTYKSHTATATASQSSDAPTGFTKSWLVTIGTGAAASAANELQLSQQIEGYNTVPLGLGASGAKDFTVSFWVKSSLTGDFSIAFQSQSAVDHYITTYSISAANTWEYKTITISGPTSGSFNTTNSTGLAVAFDLGSGSNFEATADVWSTGNKYRKSGTVAVAATSGATWQITGVQLEVGDTATPFEHRSYGDELARCQRYYQEVDRGSGIASSTTEAYISLPYIATMRAVPSFGTTGPLAMNDARVNSSQTTAHIIAYNANTSGSFTLMSNFSPSLVLYSPALMRGNTGNFVTLDAEL